MRKHKLLRLHTIEDQAEETWIVNGENVCCALFGCFVVFLPIVAFFIGRAM